MRRRLRRATVVAGLTSAAIILPCAAWYVAGSHAARQRAEAIRTRPARRAAEQAGQLADRVSRRLESLRESESRRPFTDYWTHGIPLDDCSLELQAFSPLSRGPTDPLVWAHFEIDGVGQVRMPNLDPAEAQGTSDPVQLAALEELECANSEHLAALRRRAGKPEQRHRVSAGGEVITVGPFVWHTASMSQSPALFALREVTATRAVLTQGFVVRAESLDDLLAEGTFPARIAPGEPAGVGDAAIPLSADAWTVSVDSSVAQREGELEAAGVVRRFHGVFALGTLVALIAGGAIVLLVHQSEQLARQRSRFAAAAAHELRTPLTGLRLFGEMLADDLGDESKRREYALRVSEEAERLGRVVSNVLGFSALERDALGVRPRHGDLALAVRETVEQLRPSLEASGAKLRVGGAENGVNATFDRDALHQILVNLLDNAEKYTRGLPDRTIRVEVSVGQDGRPGVSVVDRGRGVSPAIRSKLFRPFTRNPDPDAPTGLGIGLALVRALAEAQGAEVRHRSSERGGACFTVAFGLAASPQRRLAGPQAPPFPTLQARRSRDG